MNEILDMLINPPVSEEKQRALDKAKKKVRAH